MKIPSLVTSRDLRLLAPEGETHAIRVILTRVSNAGDFRHRCGTRQYIFKRDCTLGAHVLIVPLSCYMQDSPTGRYRDNRSISHDLQPSVSNGLIIQVIRIADDPEILVDPKDAPPVGVQPQPEGHKLALVRQLLVKLNAPEIVLEAIDAAIDGTTADLESFVGGITILDEPEGNPPQRAHNEDGTFTADDPATPDVNEAFKADAQPPADESAEPEEHPNPFSAEEKDDLANMHWKTFEVKYGMKKDEFRKKA